MIVKQDKMALETLNLNNWMARLNDEEKIDNVSMPGTHDSGAQRILFDAQCQSLSITEQLNLGIRFLDLRIKHENDGTFRIVHGIVEQNTTLDSIQEEVVTFLIDNPKEFVLMHIQIHRTPSSKKFTERFSEIVKNFTNHWYFTQDLPQVKNVRGRMVLIRAYDKGAKKGWDSEGYGIPCNAFNINGNSSNDFFCSQNRWGKLTQAPKRNWIKDVYTKKIYKKEAFPVRGKFLLNFVSYSHLTMSPISCGPQMNLDIYNFIHALDDKKQRLGVVITDFCGWVQAQDKSGYPRAPYVITSMFSELIISHNVFSYGERSLPELTDELVAQI